MKDDNYNFKRIKRHLKWSTFYEFANDPPLTFKYHSNRFISILLWILNQLFCHLKRNEFAVLSTKSVQFRTVRRKKQTTFYMLKQQCTNLHQRGRFVKWNVYLVYRIVTQMHFSCACHAQYNCNCGERVPCNFVSQQ